MQQLRLHSKRALDSGWKRGRTMMENTKLSGWLQITSGAVVLVLLLGGFAAVLQGQEDASLAGEHLAITARYRKEAAETRDVIKRHQLAADVYRRGTEPPYTVMNPQGRKQMVQHCERVIAYYTKAAHELDAMAAEHEALATQLRSPGHVEE